MKVGRLGALLFTQFTHLHLFFFGQRIPDCLLTLCLPMKGVILGFVSGLLVLEIQMDCKLVCLFCYHFSKISNCSIKILPIFLLLGFDYIDCCLPVRALYSLEKVTDLGAIIYFSVAMILKALHICMLLLVECDILVLITSLLPIIIM